MPYGPVQVRHQHHVQPVSTLMRVNMCTCSLTPRGINWPKDQGLSGPALNPQPAPLSRHLIPCKTQCQHATLTQPLVWQEVIPYLLRRAQENSSVLGIVPKEKSMVLQGACVQCHATQVVQLACSGLDHAVLCRALAACDEAEGMSLDRWVARCLLRMLQLYVL